MTTVHLRLLPSQVISVDHSAQRRDPFGPLRSKILSEARNILRARSRLQSTLLVAGRFRLRVASLDSHWAAVLRLSIHGRERGR